MHFTLNDEKYNCEISGFCLKDKYGDAHIIGVCGKDHCIYFITNLLGNKKVIKSQLSKKDWEESAQYIIFEAWMNYKIDNAFDSTPSKNCLPTISSSFSFKSFLNISLNATFVYLGAAQLLSYLVPKPPVLPLSVA